jgi:outer membrane protein OmpA-like peptidoglycan-associated protein
VPAHKIYVIGLGKDKPVESNKTAKGAPITGALTSG